MLVADDQIRVSEGGSGYEFTVSDEATVNELKTNGFDIKNKTEKPLVIKAIEVQQVIEPTFAEKIAAALAAGTGEVTVTMEQDETLDAAVSVPLGKQLVLNGANHTLTLGAETNFVLQDGLTLKNVKIDATALTKELIGLSADTPADAYYDVMGYQADGANKTNYHITAPVKIENSMIKELAHSIIKANASWALKNLTMTNNIIQAKINGDKFIAMNNSNSGIQTILIQNNTFYNTASNSANFIAFNAANMPKGIWGDSQNWMNWTFSNNTIVKFTTGNMGDRIQNNAVVTFNLEKNVFVDQAKISKWIGTSMTKNVAGNVYQKIDVAPADDDVSKGYVTVADAGITVPTTALDLTAEKGGIDLTIGATTKAARSQSGDPRWVVPFVAPTDVDKTTLAATIGEAEALVAPEETAPDNVKTAWATVTTTLATAQAVNADANVFQDEVDAANTALADAIAAYNTATGITEINIDNNGVAGEKDVYYNLQGVRVANPGKGVYIKNGKKVLVK